MYYEQVCVRKRSHPFEPWLTAGKRDLGGSREKLLGFWVAQGWQENTVSSWHKDGT